VTIARAQHQPVIAKHNRAAVAVDRGVLHIENSHWRILDRGRMLRESSIDRIAPATPMARTGFAPGAKPPIVPA